MLHRLLIAALIGIPLCLAEPTDAQTVPVQIKLGPNIPLGCGQLAAFSTATLLSSVSGGIPSGTKVAALGIETNTVRYRDDGTAPTATVGMPLPTGLSPWPYSGNMANMEFIPETGSATVDICFYG